MNEILEGPNESAVAIIARELNVDIAAAKRAVVAVVQQGYWIAPREPTNAMLIAYIRSYGAVPTNPDSAIKAAGKARARWKAMGESGTRRAISVKGVVRKENTHQHLGGIARAQALSAERRTEIARKAAAARWKKR